MLIAETAHASICDLERKLDETADGTFCVLREPRQCLSGHRGSPSLAFRCRAATEAQLAISGRESRGATLDSPHRTFARDMFEDAGNSIAPKYRTPLQISAARRARERHSDRGKHRTRSGGHQARTAAFVAPPRCLRIHFACRSPLIHRRQCTSQQFLSYPCGLLNKANLDATRRGAWHGRDARSAPRTAIEGGADALGEHLRATRVSGNGASNGRVDSQRWIDP